MRGLYDIPRHRRGARDKARQEERITTAVAVPGGRSPTKKCCQGDRANPDARESMAGAARIEVPQRGANKHATQDEEARQWIV